MKNSYDSMKRQHDFKMSKEFEGIFPRRYTNGQQAHEKMLEVIKY